MATLEPADASIFDTAVHVVSTEVEIAGTPTQVWDVLDDHASWVEWFPACTSVRAESERWSEPGQTREAEIGRLRLSERAIIVDAPSDLAFTILSWQLPIARRAAERIQLADTSREGEARVNLTYTGAFDLVWFGRPLWGRFSSQLVDVWGEAFENLHHHLASS